MNPKVYIITGPIGSGKSTVCAYLKKKGNLTIDLDIVSNNILESQESLPFLKSNFKNCFTDGKINRKLIAEIVFKDKVKLKILEEYLHPLVSEEIAKIINHSETDIFIEVSAPKITLLISKSIFDKLLSEYIFPIEVSKSVQSEKLLEI